MVKLNSLTSVITIFCSILLACNSCAVPQFGIPRFGPKDAKNQPQARNYIGSVAMIVTLAPLDEDDKARALSNATAFAVDADTLMTAGHYCFHHTMSSRVGVTQDEVFLFIVGGYGMPSRMIKSTVIDFRMDPDICLLKSEGHGLTPITFLPVYSDLRAGDTVRAIGAPDGYFPITRFGTVTQLFAYMQPGSEDMLMLSIDIEPGFSGGPVFWHGLVVGMVVELPKRPSHGGHAITSSKMQDFYDAYKRGSLATDFENIIIIQPPPPPPSEENASPVQP